MFNSVEDIDLFLPTEDEAKKWFASVRWGEWPICPHCGNSKSYKTSGGFKCANKTCGKKYSVIGKSVFEGSNIPVKDLIKVAFIFSKTRGRCSQFEVTSQTGLSTLSEVRISKKLSFIFPYVERIGKSNYDITSELIRKCCELYHEYVKTKSSLYINKNPYHIPDNAINNISDASQYNMLFRYVSYYLNTYCKKKGWFFMDFTTPSDLLSETFLRMHEENIKEYNTSSVLRQIWRTANSLWVTFLRAHPKYNDYLRKKAKIVSKERNRSLPKSHLVYLIKQRKFGAGLGTRDVYEKPELINSYKKSILIKRRAITRVKHLNSSTGKPINKSIVAKITHCFGFNLGYQKNGVKCSVSYWNNACDTIGKAYLIKSDVIESAKNAYTDYMKNPLLHKETKKVAAEDFVKPTYKMVAGRKTTPVIQMKDGIEIARYNSITEAAEITGVQKSSLIGVLNGENKTTGGFGWKRDTSFIEENDEKIKSLTDFYLKHKEIIDQFKCLEKEAKEATGINIDLTFA